MDHPEFIHGLNRLASIAHGCVATIGSFDGVHRGHKVVIAQVKEKAAALGLPSLVMVFEPQPHEFFSRESAPARLMRLREKVCALFDSGVDRVLCLKFDESLRSLTAQDYIERVLIKGLGVKHLVIGDDFRFGCDRSGDFAMLREAGRHYGFTVCDTLTQQHQGERISSTRIRQLLFEGQLEAAARLLGRPFSVTGRVIYGKQLGRSLGFPTVNIGLGRYRSPVRGVYTVLVRDVSGGATWRGVANVGVRPTVGGGSKPLLEVHLLDQDLNLYGHFLTVQFMHKLRDEKRFNNVDELTKQIEKDCARARQFFSIT